jgi:hypothetical protein
MARHRRTPRTDASASIEAAKVFMQAVMDEKTGAV